jgi:hypothetical protein
MILIIALNPAVDISSETEFVRSTRKIRTSKTRHDPGGGGINVARITTTLGGDVEALYSRSELILINGASRIAASFVGVSPLPDRQGSTPLCLSAAQPEPEVLDPKRPLIRRCERVRNG